MFLLAHTGLTLGAVWLIGHFDKAAALNAATAVPLSILGANLPDLIDKPIGLFAPKLGLVSGRGIAHTLAFNLALLSVALSWSAWGLLYVALASIGHLVLDSMWRLPRVLFWPMYGFTFPRVGHRGFRVQIQAWWRTLWTDPRVFVTELIGAASIVAYLLQVYRV